MGAPGGFIGQAHRTLCDSDFRIKSIAAGRARLQYEDERAPGNDPRKGYTGVFTPRFTGEEVGSEAILLDDVPYRALSKSVPVTFLAEQDRETFQSSWSPVEAVAWYEAIMWTTRQMVLDVAAIATIYKFPNTAALSEEGCVLPG